MTDKVNDQRKRGIRNCPGKRLIFLALIPAALSIGLVYLIALKSGYNVHPDEYVHLDAVCYYENHWWPPDLNSDGLLYSGYGWSRLYDGELVYLLYGKIIKISTRIKDRAPSGEEAALSLETSGAGCSDLITSYPRYRPLNVWLYAITLLILFGLARKHPWPFLIALLLLCLPQVNYIYAYVNSDAWGLSMSIFLFVYVVMRREKIFRSWTDLLALSVLTALVVLAKKTFWLSIPYAYLLIGLEEITRWKENRSIISRNLLIRLPFLFLLTLIWVAPLKIYYPLSQGNFTEEALKMREARADPEFKPSTPTNIGYHMAERGYPFWAAANLLWWKQSAASFYGLFGYMSERLPQWLYTLVYGCLAILAGITYSNLAHHWKDYPLIERWMVLAAPLFILLPVLASLYNSWTFDFQPQGRYLFAALIPLALVEGGLVCHETRRVRGIRLVTWLLLYGICLAVLVIGVLGNPNLVPE